MFSNSSVVNKGLVIFVFLFFYMTFPACSKIAISIDEMEADISDPELSIRKTGFNMINNLEIENRFFQCQGMAINGNIMYRLHSSGICKTYDISDIDNPVPLHIFHLGSYMWSNHCNTAQFYKEDDNTFLYIAGSNKKCFVEIIDGDSSKLIQTISFSTDSYTMDFNIICGDDGYLWAFGGMTPSGTLNLLKLRKPKFNVGDVTLTDNDVLESFVLETDYNYYSKIWQGGKCYNGKLFFLFGSFTSGKELAIYDTHNGKLLYQIKLDGYIEDEPEDCELLDNKIILTSYGGNGYYIIDYLS